MKLPEYKSKLIINEDLIINFRKKKPNWFHRFFQKLILGFVWEDLK